MIFLDYQSVDPLLNSYSCMLMVVLGGGFYLELQDQEDSQENGGEGEGDHRDGHKISVKHMGVKDEDLKDEELSINITPRMRNSRIRNQKEEIHVQKLQDKYP